MAASKTIFNPTTKGRKTVSFEMETAYLQGVGNDPEFYIKMTVSANDLDGNPIGPIYINSLSDFPDDGGTKQHPSGSSSAYSNLTECLQNYIRHVIEGDGGNTAMDI
jgi:hypothetical protein